MNRIELVTPRALSGRAGIFGWCEVVHRRDLRAGRQLSVEPEILEAEAVVDAVDHHRHPLDLGMLACRLTRVEDDRTGAVLGQPLFDFPH